MAYWMCGSTTVPRMLWCQFLLHMLQLDCCNLHILNDLNVVRCVFTNLSKRPDPKDMLSFSRKDIQWSKNWTWNAALEKGELSLHGLAADRRWSLTQEHRVWTQSRWRQVQEPREFRRAPRKKAGRSTSNTKPGDHVSQCRPKKGNRWWKGAWNGVAVTAVTWSDLTKSAWKYHVLNQKTSAQWDDACLEKSAPKKTCFYDGFYAKFHDVLWMFYECQNQFFVLEIKWPVKWHCSPFQFSFSKSWIAQEETHGDALSFSQRSIGFVAPDSQLSTFCPEFSFQVYVTSSEKKVVQRQICSYFLRLP